MKKYEPALMRKEISGDWMFRDATSQEWHRAAVPGCVHTDLLSNNLIPDPYDGRNEEELQWIGERDWVYQTLFTVPSAMLDRNRVDIVFRGLDTYAKVYLNDSLLLSADNMFREWRDDAQEMLKRGENKLTIFFRNVFDVTVPKFRNAPYELMADPKNDRGDPRVAMYSRKAQFHYGWDGGPRLVTCGIWKPIVIEAWDSFKICGAQIVQERVTTSNADILSHVSIHSAVNQLVSITITADSLTLFKGKRELKEGSNTISLEGSITRPNLWWSNGIGTQYLYAYTVVVTNVDGVRDTYSAKLGVRSLRIIRQKDSRDTSMVVELNGVPVFMKGAMYVPLDMFQHRVTAQKHESIVKAAADVHMNMLRVWGGGIFEDDSFYEMCDKYGILVWQDMLFACAMYPAGDDFLSSVKQEVIDNVTRIRNHPSIALYCGNNEHEIGWERLGWKERYTSEVQAQYEADLKKLFYVTIPEALNEADPTRYYHASSPSAGFGTMGFGNGDIPTCIEKYYRNPKDVSSYLYTSQVLQAQGVQMAVEAHRRNMPYCMASLAWQIDDCWPASSCSSIDYYGKWKALHYIAKHVYAPVLIAPKVARDAVEFFIVSDEQEKIDGELYVTVRTFNGKIIYVQQYPITIRPNTSRIYLTLAKRDLLGSASEDRVVLVSRFVRREGGGYENFTYFAYPKDLQLDTPSITIATAKVTDGVEISLTSSTLAKNVYLTCDGTDGSFSENYFDLLPHEMKTITLRTDAAYNDIKNRFKAVSLVDMS